MRRFLKSFMTRLKVWVTLLKHPKLPFSHNIHNRGISLRGLLSDLVTPVLITDLVTQLPTETVLIVEAVRDSRGRVSSVTPRPLLTITRVRPRLLVVTRADLTPGGAMGRLVRAPRLPGASLSPRPGPRPGSTVTPVCLRPDRGDLDPGNPGPG